MKLESYLKAYLRKDILPTSYGCGWDSVPRGMLGSASVPTWMLPKDFPPTTYHKNISMWLIASSKHSIWKGNRRGESQYQSDTLSLRSESFGYKQSRKSMERYFKRTKVPSMGEHWEAITVSKTPSQKNKHCTLEIATEKYRRNSVLCLFLLLWQNTLGKKRQLKWKWIYLAHRAVLLSVTAVQLGQWELEAANQYIYSQDQSHCRSSSPSLLLIPSRT